MAANLREEQNRNEIFEIIIKCPKADVGVMKLKKHIEARTESFNNCGNDKW